MDKYLLFNYSFTLFIIIIIAIFIYKYLRFLKYLAIFKKISWNKYYKVASSKDWKVQKDKYSVYGFPKIIGKYRGRKFSIHLIDEKNSPIDKTEFVIEFKNIIPNIIWVITLNYKNYFLKNKYFLNLMNKENNSNFMYRCNNQFFLEEFINNPEILKNLKELNNNEKFYSLIISSKNLKFYSSKWIINTNMIIKDLKLLTKLTNDIERIVIKINSSDTIPKAVNEKIIDKYSKKALGIKRKKNLIINPSDSISLCGISIATIIIGTWISISTPNIIGKIIATSILIPIGIMMFILGYMMNYYWKKWRIEH